MTFTQEWWQASEVQKNQSFQSIYDLKIAIRGDWTAPPELESTEDISMTAVQSNSSE